MAILRLKKMQTNTHERRKTTSLATPLSWEIWMSIYQIMKLDLYLSPEQKSVPNIKTLNV